MTITSSRPGFEDESTTIEPSTEDSIPAASPRPRDRGTLTQLTGIGAGTVYTLGARDELVGRGREASIRIDDAGVSRRHCRIVCTGALKWLVEDLGSRNGTRVQGKPVVSRELEDGDRVGVGPKIVFRFTMSDEAEAEVLRRVYESSVRDGLTGAFNRKHFLDRLGAELAFAIRHRTDLSIVIFDLDHFKRVNDTFGHQAGDQVLRSVAQIVARTLRTEDVFGRYGGEEFAVIARGIDLGHATMLAERIRARIEAAPVAWADGTIPVTISAGVASLGCVKTRSVEELVRVADERLYQGKRQGRNRVVGGS